MVAALQAKAMSNADFISIGGGPIYLEILQHFPHPTFPLHSPISPSLPISLSPRDVSSISHNYNARRSR